MKAKRRIVNTQHIEKIVEAGTALLRLYMVSGDEILISSEKCKVLPKINQSLNDVVMNQLTQLPAHWQEVDEVQNNFWTP